QRPGVDLAAERHIGKGIGHQRLCTDLLLNQPIEIGNGRSTASQKDVVDIVELPSGEEELQRTGNLLNDSLFERLQHLAVVVIWMPTLLLGYASFTHRLSIAPLNYLRLLFATEVLFTGKVGATIMQNTERGHGGVDIDLSDRQLIMRSHQ